VSRDLERFGGAELSRSAPVRTCFRLLRLHKPAE
jgi:hypothetical protein